MTRTDVGKAFIEQHTAYKINLSKSTASRAVKVKEQAAMLFFSYSMQKMQTVSNNLLNTVLDN